MGPFTTIVGAGLSFARFAVRLARAGPPKALSLSERLEMLPTAGAPLDRAVDILWSRRGVPFIEASSDADLATTLGIVHAHLRLAEMELLRLLAHGRLSEAVGPVALDVDHLLRLFDFGRAAPETLTALPEETRRWLEAFVGGVNHQIRNAPARPHEFRVLGIESAPWRVSDILTIARLVSADVNWVVWSQLLRLREGQGWDALWRRVRRQSSAPDVAAAPNGASSFSRILGPAARWASNSIAISAPRSATGGALIASDPHLGLHLPGAWLVAGYKTPTRNAVGLMPPGLPFVAIGRNPWIAWGGTNLHAASSDFFDVSDLPQAEIARRRVVLRARGWPDRAVTLRETPLGPIVSDAKLLGLARRRPIALRWMGHRASDEFTAMRLVEQARDWTAFRRALDGVSVPGQTMTFADVDGRVGRARAAWLPDRTSGALAKPTLDRRDDGAWRRIRRGSDLPAEFDPPRGFVVSANERPETGADPDPVPIGFFFSPPDRARRLTALLEAEASMTLEGVRSLQSDVFCASSFALSRRFLELLPPPEELGEASSAARAMAEWDGRYEAASSGALAFELMFRGFVRAHYSEAAARGYWAVWDPRSLVSKDLSEEGREAAARSLRRAIPRAGRRFSRFGRWGRMHRLRLSHPFGFAPVVGRRYVVSDAPADGGDDTINKTASSFGDEGGAAIYGSCARHISDLSDLDRNYFVLLGGQDGWLGSESFADQLPLWRAGRYLQAPLRPETARASSPYRTTLAP